MASTDSIHAVHQAANALRSRLVDPPALAIVLGSGFTTLQEAFPPESIIDVHDIPHWPPCRVPGHRGQLVLVRHQNLPFLLLNGRAHYYEGYSMSEITFPVRVLAAFGIQHLLLTNAAGALIPDAVPGDFLLIKDHINFMGENPLRGALPPFGDPFVDLCELYEPRLRQCLQRAAQDLGIPMREGIYLAVSGPTYETPAEIRTFRQWGADAVGMSTVPEAIVAHQNGIKVAALSCLTNLAAGLSTSPLSHQDVLAQGRQTGPQAVALFRSFLSLYAQEFHS